MPPSFNITSPPSASKLMSVVSSVIVEPLSISAMIVVKVLFVKVSEVSVPTSVVVAFAMILFYQRVCYC